MLMNDASQLEFACKISGLLYKYLFREITDDELTALHTWAYANPENEELFEAMKDPDAFSESYECFRTICRGAASDIPIPLSIIH
jgi:hypothetical protein